MGALQDVRNCAAVSDACVMIRKSIFKSIFQAIGGFDESLQTLQAVDLALTARRLGYRPVYTWVDLRRGGNQDRPARSHRPEDMSYLREKWDGSMDDDPSFFPLPDISSLVAVQKRQTHLAGADATPARTADG